MSLWEKAMALPLAAESDFYGAHRRPHGVDSQHLRVIKDTALRSRLIMAGMAEGLQSPKGPQKIASIIRLYADFNAPQPLRGSRGTLAQRLRPAERRGAQQPAQPYHQRRARGLERAAGSNQPRHQPAQVGDRDARGR